MNERERYDERAYFDSGDEVKERPVDERKPGGTGKMLKSAAVLGLGVLAMTGGVRLYSAMFGRYNRPDYRVTPGLRVYSRISDRLTREEIPFKSDNVRLAGYYYPAEFPRGLVVFCHGLHAGADDYLAAFEYLVNNHYSVFAFDTKGTYDSGGDSTVGLCEALVDLDHALDFVAADPRFAGLPVLLLGHSCGGYAVTSVLSLHPEVRACAAIAPMRDANTMIVDKGELYTKILALPKEEISSTFLDMYQKKLFGRYALYNGIRGINSTDSPVLIAHGALDMVVEYFSKISLIGCRSLLRNTDVFYYTGTGACSGHDSIWHSEASVNYQKWVKAEIKRQKRSGGDGWTKEEEARFCADLDHDLYSEVNHELFDSIVHLYDYALGYTASSAGIGK